MWLMRPVPEAPRLALRIVIQECPEIGCIVLVGNGGDRWFQSDVIVFLTRQGAVGAVFNDPGSPSLAGPADEITIVLERLNVGGIPVLWPDRDMDADLVQFP